MADDNKWPELCLGPPCRHFPAWVETPQDARDYLAWKILSAPLRLHYVLTAAKPEGKTDG